MHCSTLHFGQIDLEEEDVIRVPGGITPFPWATRFALLSRVDEYPFAWLQSLDDHSLAFVVAPLGILFPQRAAEALAEAGLDASDPDRAVALGITVLAPNPDDLTINLLAPVVVDLARMEARQLILDGPVELARRPLLAALDGGAELRGDSLTVAEVSGPRRCSEAGGRAGPDTSAHPGLRSSPGGAS